MASSRRLLMLLGCAALTACARSGGSVLPDDSSATTDPLFSHPAAESILFSFGGNHDGRYPQAGLVAFDGVLYGTTSNGPARAGGTAFSMTPSGAEKVLAVFGGDRGAEPFAGLTISGGVFYGTTSAGGAHQDGTAFSLTTGGKVSVLHDFGAGNDGAEPLTGLTAFKGVLYGTTWKGGAANDGTVFSITTSGEERVLYSFKGGADGANPRAPLTVFDDVLYGTTFSGGGRGHCEYGCGTAFKITTSGKETVLHRFGGGKYGGSPLALMAYGGNLYGVAGAGGRNNIICPFGCGLVFKLTPSGKESVIYAFGASYSDGEVPEGRLLELKGKLYGTTLEGGNSSRACPAGAGTIFSLTFSGDEKILYAFNCTPDGAMPEGGLTNLDGTLYGTTSGGGTYGRGAIFTLTL